MANNILLFSSDRYFTEGVLGPFIKACCRLGVHPNGLTVSSMVTTLLMVWMHEAMGSEAGALVPLLMMYKWFADVVDGPVARQCGKASVLGGLLDTLADWMFMVAVGGMGIRMLLSDRLAVWEAYCVGAILASVPWAILVAGSGWKALTDHGVWKNGDGGLKETLIWNLTENTFVTITAAAVAYAVLIQKRIS